MDAGIAAIAGAAVGACGTALTAAVAGFFARSQSKLQLLSQGQQLERQIRADHAAQLREPRREAYAAYAAEISAKLDSLWWTVTALSETPSRRQAAQERLESYEPSSSTTYERVLLEGPEDVAHAAADVGQATEGAFALAFAWLAQAEGTSPEDHGDPAATLREALQEATRARRRFRLLAMQVIQADGEETQSDEARARFEEMRRQNT